MCPPSGDGVVFDDAFMSRKCRGGGIAARHAFNRASMIYNRDKEWKWRFSTEIIRFKSVAHWEYTHKYIYTLYTYLKHSFTFQKQI